jgi:nucleotide-binding universal stress UspA family protein
VYQTVLVPTDGSDASAAAVEQAVELADAFGATVHFLYVVDVGTEMAASGVGTVADELTTSLEEMASDALDSAAARAEDAGVPHERVTREGFPHEVIGAYSEEHGIDLVTLGASGRSGIGGRLLGSTTERVVRSVDTSVLVARP